MNVETLSADHENSLVVIKSSKGKLVWLEPEDAITLAQGLMDAAGMVLNATNDL